MKLIIAVTVIAMVAMGYADDDDWWPCTSDDHCEYDDCCVENIYRGDGTKTCRDFSEFMRPCGGRYFCQCEYPYVCAPHTSATPNYQRIPGSNGTCQYPPGYQPPLYRRPYYGDRRR